MTPFSRLLQASAILICAGGLGAGGAYALDRNQPVQVAQVLPPAVIPGVGPDSGDPNDPGGMAVRLDRLENDLRQANGRIEELENRQKQLEDALKRFQQDVELRLGGVAPPAVAAGAPPAPGVAPVEPGQPGKPLKRSDAFDPNADPNAPGSPRVLGTTAASAPLSPAGPPLDISGRPVGAPPPGAPAAPAGVLPAGPLIADNPPANGPAPRAVTGTGIDFTDGPNQQFAAAVDAYRAGDYAKAEEQLKQFIIVNASHKLVPDAIFYLGETYFQRSRPREAAEQYLKLSTDYAKSTRAPEGMLRLGQSLAALGSNEQACATLAEVGKRYPTAAPAVKKSAEREMQKDHC
ncbi:MAG: tol-pal system protein YbgF [Bradyrhizobium sp.]|nr:MAG: tol-pal system protein YbgF [Bradyrhizobium sp.]